MDCEFPEQFKCPICFEIPENEIFQCENGHTICDNCVTDLSLCPQCRVNLGTKRIRNRGLEDILDMMTFNCSFKSDGCRTQVTRKEMSSHYDNCEFGGERVSLCSYLGYSCKYKMRTRNLHESLQHLRQEHSIISTNDSTIEVKIGDIKWIDRKIKGLWNPVLLNVHSEIYLLVVYSDKGNISFSCIWIGAENSSKLDGNFRIKSKNSQVPALEWTARPIRHAECQLALKFPPLQVSLDFLLSAYVDEDVLKIEVVLSDNTINNEVCNKTIVELESDIILPSPQRDPIDDIIATLLLYFSEPTGDGHMCNVCRVQPISGPRFQCLQCWDYDLCSSCMATNEHSFHHFVLLHSYEQVAAMYSEVKRDNLWRPYIECHNKDNLAAGYIYGSVYSDAEELRCQKCENQPDFICLQCGGPWGLCRFSFLDELGQHDASHFFVLAMTDSARQFAIYILRKHGNCHI